jgi:RND superfamily putative drug exporter
MLLAGNANWWLPRNLDRLLPHLNVEGTVKHNDPGAKPDPHSQPAPALQPLLDQTAA